MIVQLGWPDCRPSQFGFSPSEDLIDAFWLECTPEEAQRIVEPRISDKDMESVEDMRRWYGWPHRLRAKNDVASSSPAT